MATSKDIDLYSIVKIYKYIHVFLAKITRYKHITGKCIVPTNLNHYIDIDFQLQHLEI